MSALCMVLFERLVGFLVFTSQLYRLLFFLEEVSKMARRHAESSTSYPTVHMVICAAYLYTYAYDAYGIHSQ